MNKTVEGLWIVTAVLALRYADEDGNENDDYKRAPRMATTKQGLKAAIRAAWNSPFIHSVEVERYDVELAEEYLAEKPE